MGSRRILELAFTLLIVSTVSSIATAQLDCSSILVSLSPCLDYITGNSSTPSSVCCNQLSNVIKAQAICLCELVNGSVPSTGPNINQTRALGLPAACNLQTPSINQCNVTAPSPSGTTPPNGPTGGSPGTPPGGGNGSGDRINVSYSYGGLFYILIILMASIFISISSAVI